MDAISFLKLLWRPTAIPANATANYTQSSFAETDDDDADSDSFFDLDVNLSDFDTKSCDSRKIPLNVVDDDEDDDVFLEFHKSNSTPASPISILTSSPSYRGQMFGKSRAANGGDESPKRNSSDPKDGFMKYLKPFRVSYVRGASRRYGYSDDDMRFATCRFSPSSSPMAPPPKKGKPESVFRVGYKNLGNSKSAISSSSAAGNGGGRRTSDSIVEQQEGINGAILHCKKSYYPSE